jgi:hypothetical protein
MTNIRSEKLYFFHDCRINSPFPLPVLPFVHNDLLFLIVVNLEHVVLVHFLDREIHPRHGSSGGCLRADRNVENR